MIHKKKTVISVFILGFTILYNELLVYHFVLKQCQWPTKIEDPIRAMMLTDVHLLGPLNDNWFERTRVEAQIRRVYQKALSLHQPDVVFILGDLFNEGLYVDDNDFSEYLSRFSDIFETPPHIQRYCLVGNHDIGFHNELRPNTSLRFKNAFKESDNSLITIKDTHFILLNSVTLYGDSCQFCSETEADIQQMSKRLHCARLESNSSDCNDLKDKLPFYARPILIQHYPTFREDDRTCLDHDYSELETFEEGREVLSKNATEFVGESLNPVVAFCGHSHHYCRSINMWNVEEFTIASFSWQHKPSPSFLMVEFSGDKYAVAKCDMPRQSTVISIYIFSIFSILAIIAYSKSKMIQKKYHPIYSQCWPRKG